ncbi:MAG: signal peptidase I, partial [Pseudomonadales bacterium]
MGFDFELVLVIGCLITGLGWAIELIWWKPKRLHRLNEAVAAAGGQLPENSPLAETKEPLLAEYSRSFFPILAVVLIFRSFFF